MDSRGWGRFGGGAVLLCVTLGCATETPPTKSEAVQLAAEDKHAQLVSGLKDYIWTGTSDIELVVLFCRSQFVVADSNSTCRLHGRSAAPAQRFADALWAAWAGRTVVARTEFEQLLDDTAWSLWGEVGLIETAYHTENHMQLSALLDDFPSSSSSADPRHRYLDDRYNALLASETADWQQLEELLSQYSYDDIVRAPFLFSLQAQLLFVNGQSMALAELLDDASSAVQRTTMYLLHEADYLAFTGDDEWTAVVREFSERYPDNRRLAIEVAFRDILNESGRDEETALHRLDSIAAVASRDVKLLLDMAITLALYRQPDYSELVYRRIDVMQTNLQDFTALHVLAAWNAVYRGDLVSANNSLVQALEVAPRHLNANYLKALIARRQEDPQRGLEALEILFDHDPYNENFLAMIEDFYETFRTPSWERLYEMALSRAGD